ncbi:MAG TPA: cytochrome c [Gemmataceae bacterium]|nr:cytochrome c [Gemmataceae bacterium]
MDKSRYLRFRWAGACLILLLTISCSQIPLEMAAPMLTPAPESRATEEDLAAGREIYISKEKCARCHNPKPVYNYSAKDWKKSILPVMGQLAKLKPEEYEDLALYVTAGSTSRPKP